MTPSTSTLPARMRVHEIASELARRGVNMSNGSVIDELNARGFDVKSHSSRIATADALAVIESLVVALGPAPK